MTYANPFQPAQQSPPMVQPAPQQNYAPPAPTGYAPAPQQQYAQPAPAQQGYAPGGDEFGAPAPQSERPRIRDLEGCLLLIMPKRLEEGVVSRTLRTSDGQPAVQDRMTCDIVVLDAPEGRPSPRPGGYTFLAPEFRTHGVVHYGGRPEARPPTPHSKQHPVPMFIEGSYVSNKGLVSQLRDAFRNRQTGHGHKMVLGRLHAGESTDQGREPPWLLSAQPTPQDQELARAWLRAHPQDAFTSPGAAR